MRIGTWIRAVGLAVQSAKGWVTLLVAAPAVAAMGMAVLEQRPWSEVILIALCALLLALAVALLVIRVYRELSSHFTSRKDQIRIAKLITDAQNTGISEFDTGTIAAIWAGTREEGDILRHLRFRQLKSLIANGEIQNTRQSDRTKGPNINTWIPLAELREYFRKSSVIGKSD